MISPVIHETPVERSLVISYLALRKVIGTIGVALPFELVIGNGGLESSISDYYYTGTRNVFIGSLWAISMILLSYRGYHNYRYDFDFIHVSTNSL